MIGFFTYRSVFLLIKKVVVCAAVCFGRLKAVSDFKALDRADGADSLCQICAQLLKAGFAYTGRHAPDNAFHNAAAGILPGAAVIQISLCKLGSGC